VTIAAESVPAAPAEPLGLVVQTAECPSGTVTLISTDDGWIIRGVHRTRTFRGKPAVYTFRAARCDCRTDPASPRLQRSSNATCRRDDTRHMNGNCACYNNYGYRELCPERPGHNGQCHRTKDHCSSLGHVECVQALFAEVVKSYGRPARLGVDITDRRRVTAGKDERAEYRAWLAENDPTATDPYAAAQL